MILIKDEQRYELYDKTHIEAFKNAGYTEEEKPILVEDEPILVEDEPILVEKKLIKVGKS